MSDVEELIIFMEGNGNRYVRMIKSFGGLLINFKKSEGTKLILVDLSNFIIIVNIFLRINYLAIVNWYILLIQVLDDLFRVYLFSFRVVKCPYHQVVPMPHSPSPSAENGRV